MAPDRAAPLPPAIIFCQPFDPKRLDPPLPAADRRASGLHFARDTSPVTPEVGVRERPPGSALASLAASWAPATPAWRSGAQPLRRTMGGELPPTATSAAAVVETSLGPASGTARGELDRMPCRTFVLPCSPLQSWQQEQDRALVLSEDLELNLLRRAGPGLSPTSAVRVYSLTDCCAHAV
jgi:hypothetical protein